MPPPRFEPLGDHDRSSFSCGVPELDRYLHRQAGQDARRHVAATFVLVEEALILGYYTLSAYGIRLAELPEKIAAKLPRYPILPGTLLGRLAVDARQRGRGYGQMLLMDALARSWHNTSEVASIGVVAEAIDEGAREFYLHHEFIPLLENINKMFLPMATIQRLFKEAK